MRAGAWHNLGTVHTKQVSALELLQSANGDYDVIKMPDYAQVALDADGNLADVSGKWTARVEWVEDPTRRKLVRKHPVTGEWQVLGTASPKYQPVTNREAFVEFGDALIDAAEPTVATCGVLREGRQAFMCWKLPRDLLVGGVDAIDWWLLVRTSHDSSAPLTAAITPLRTVCANTVRWNLRNAISTWTVRHTANAKVVLQQAREALKLSYAYAEKWDVLAEGLVNTPLSVNAFDKIITDNFGPKEEAGKVALDRWDEKRGKLTHLFAQADTQANVRGTAWAGLQAVVEFCDWETKVDLKRLSKAWANPDAYRFWRSLVDEKSVTNPKQAALRVFGDLAGLDIDSVNVGSQSEASFQLVDA